MVYSHSSTVFKEMYTLQFHSLQDPAFKKAQFLSAEVLYMCLYCYFNCLYAHFTHVLQSE